MKKIYTLFVALIIMGCLMAQTPQSFKYQAVARDASGDVLVDQAIGMQISILQGSITGTAVYVETFMPTTNGFGLINLNIGEGTVVSGDITTIDWSADTYFIKIEMDLTGGTTYEEYGISQLLSVPYALHAKTAANTFSGNYSDLTGTPNNISTFTNDAGYLASFTETDPVFGAHAANGIGSTNITNWTTAYGWGDHSTAGYTTTDTTLNETEVDNFVANNGYLTSFTETDPIYTAWDKSTGISITASKVSDFATSVTNNTAVLANTAKVTNATHTGDATGATALTVVGINGTSLAGLATGILKNTTSTGVPSIAVEGTDYLTPTGSAASLTNFPTLNQNTTGNAATVTTNADLTGMVTSVGNETTVVTNANLTGEVTSSGNATTITNSAVIGKVLTGFTSGAGTVTATDNILQAIQKLNGNDAPVHTIGESYGGGIVFYVYDGGQHGLIAATADQSPVIRWHGGTYTNTRARADGVGAGLKNTAIIIANQGPVDGVAFAATVCNEYSVTVGGVTYGDWYLPSIFELNLLYLQKDIVGNFVNNTYWSSSEVDDNYAWGQHFGAGFQSDDRDKEWTYPVRAVRAF